MGHLAINTVLERTINTMTKSGLRSVDYATGHSNRIEVAVRRALMTGYGQIQRYNAEQVAAELGTDYFEVSAHGGARPSHAEWQGKVYSRAELYSVCGLDTATGLCGINCYHSYDPFIPGVSVRRYSDDDLAQIRKEDARQREYGGKTYNKYEALQHQRKLETTLRKYRRDVHLLEKGSADPDTILNKKIKYQVTYGQYKHFSKAMELPMQRARIYQDGLKVSTYVKTTRRSLPIQLPYVYNGRKEFIPKNTAIEHVKTIAGKGSKSELRFAKKLADRYGGDASDWKKRVGKVTSDKYIFDIHWYEHKGIMYREKIKFMKER